MDDLFTVASSDTPVDGAPSTFLRQVAEDLVRRHGSDLREIAIVFNNQRPAQYLKRELTRLLGRVFWSPQFFTIQDFMRRSTARIESPATAQVFLLNKIHTDLQREHNPGFEESLDHFFPVAEIILSDFAQLDYELAPVETVFQELSDQALIDRQFEFLTPEQQDFLVRFWSSFSRGQQGEMQARFLQLWRMLPVLYKRFKEALAAREAQTMAGIYRDLAEARPWTHDVATDFKQVLFVGFNALNACEIKLFKRWQEEGKALFYFDADAYYVDDPLMEAGYFIRQHIGNHGLRNAMGEFVDRLSRRTTSGQIQLLAAPGDTAQVKVLAQLLADQPPQGTAAVILADESLLVPVLQSLPEQLEINVTMGYPMTESLSHSLLDLFLEIQLQYASQTTRIREDASPEDLHIAHELLIDFVAHPFSGCTAESRSALMQEFARHQMPALPLSWVREQFAEQVVRFPSMFRRVSNVSDLMDGLQEVSAELLLNLEQGGAVRGRMEGSLLEQAIQACRQLQFGFQAYPQLSIPLAVRLIRRMLGKLTAALTGDPLSGLQIMGLLESRNLNFDHVYVLGANEGKLPGNYNTASFLPYNIRRAYHLPVMENQQALSAYLLYRLLHGFDTVHMLYNSVVDSSNSGEISRFARQLQHESGLQVEEVSVSLGARPVGELAVAESRAVAQNLAVVVGRELTIPKDGIVWERLQGFLRPSPSGERRSLSASAFTLYLNSPLEFFFKYLAGIKEPPDLLTEIRSNRLGTVIHRVMEWILKPFHESGTPLNKETIRRVLPRLGALCRQAVLEEFYGARTARSQITDPQITDPQIADHGADIELTSQERIILRLSEEYCRLFLRHDQELGHEILLAELENETDYLLEFPITVAGRPETILLKGIIDRVDVVGGQKRIVDYKTGGDTLEVPARGLGHDGLFDFDFFGTNWKDSNKAFIQTLYYTHIYEQLSGSQYVEPHLYSIRQMRTNGTLFHFKVPYKGVHAIAGPVLEQVKADFVAFLRQRLEALFDPSIPFMHPPGATVYEGNPVAGFLKNTMDFGEWEEK